MRMDLDIVTVNYKSSDRLVECLKSIDRHLGSVAATIRIQNNDPLDDLTGIYRYCPQALITHNRRNIGFAAAVNKALQQGDAPFVLIINPDNPTGAVYSKSVLEEINKFCADQNIYHISDEAYENFVFDGVEHFSPGSFDPELAHTISIFSFSKSYSMAGYRVGYMVYPSVLQNELLKVQDTIGICPPGPSQSAGEAALKLGTAYTRAFLPEMVRVRELIIEKLRTLDILELPVTKGGFYFFITINNDL